MCHKRNEHRLTSWYFNKPSMVRNHHFGNNTEEHAIYPCQLVTAMLWIIRKRREVPFNTFNFLHGKTNFFAWFWSFHEERKDAAKTKDIHKFLAVVNSFFAWHGVVQNFDGAATRHLLLSKKKSNKHKNNIIHWIESVTRKQKMKHAQIQHVKAAF